MSTPRGEAYRSFFQQLIDELREKHAFTNARVGQPRNFYHFTSGVIPRVYYDAFFTNDERVASSVLIDVKNWEETRSLFDQLEQDQAKIEKEFGSKLIWSKTGSVRARYIRVERPGSIEYDAAALRDIHTWLIETLLRLKKVFDPRLRAYK